MAENSKVPHFDEVVFENRNKAYGAYDARKTYPRIVTKAFLIGASVFVLAIVGPSFISKIFKEKAKEEVVVDVTLEDVTQKEEDKPLEETPPPPPPEETPPPQQETVNIDIPEPKPDNEVKHQDPPPPVEKVANTQISTQNQEGAKTESLITSVAPPPADTGVGKVAEVKKEVSDEVFTSVDQKAEYPGGIKAMYAYISSKLEYPETAAENGTQGKVMLRFIVERDGSLGDIKVITPLKDGCSEAAVKSLKGMPRWKPGQKNGEGVRSYFTLPVDFVLGE